MDDEEAPMPYSKPLHWDYRDGRVAAVAAGIVYGLWMLEVVLPGVSSTHGALADPESTFGRFLDSAHRTASILVVLAAALGLTLGAPHYRRWLRVSWWAMIVFGATSLVTSVLPGRCVVSTDVVCAAESLAEGTAGATVAQILLGVVAVCAALVGVVTLAVNRWRSGDRAWPFVAVLAALQLVASVAVLVLAQVLYSSAGDDQPGVTLSMLARFHLVTVSVWLLTAGLLSGPWTSSARAAHPLRTRH